MATTVCRKGYHSFKVLVDHELLEGVCDPNELEHERDIERRSEHPFAGVDGFGDPRASGSFVDFRDQIDMGHYDCTCEGDCVCVRCCTVRDLGLIPENARGVGLFNHRVRLIFNRLEEVCDLVMPLNLALYLGFVRSRES